MHYKNVKRILDIMLSCIGLLILIPLFFIIIIMIKVDSRGPVFFKQKRVGCQKNDFYILKFRTMKNNCPQDTPTHLLENPDKFITPFGRILRKTSIDELPQLWNVLVGEMSIIGPRPALWNQYDLICERDKYGANDIRPGLTGIAQINGRDELSIEMKAHYDGLYVESMSLLTDVKCFFKTIFSVIRHIGVIEGKTKLND